MSMSANLPEWMKYELACFNSEDHCDEVDIDKLFKALAIAWEALHDCAHGRPHDNVEDAPQYAEDAMRCIEKLGEGV